MSNFIKLPIRRGFAEVSALFNLIQGRGVICGGYARYCVSPVLNPAPAGDVDVYAHTVEDFESLKKDLREHLRKSKDNPVSISYERTIKGDLAYTPQIQLIKPLVKGRMVGVGPMETILSNFDFTIARAGILSETEGLVDELFENDEIAQRLRLRNIHCPISSTLRCTKYVKKGYWLRPADTLALFLDWDARSPEYRAEIIEGVEEIEEAIASNVMLSQDRLTAIYELMTVD